MTTKTEYLFAALNHQLYRKSGWVISAFSTTEEPEDQWKHNPYPYRIVKTPQQVYYVNPEDLTELLPIKDTHGYGRLFDHKSRVIIDPSQVPNAVESMDVPIGNVLANFIMLIYPFGGLIKFKTGKISVKGLESELAGLLRSNPKPGETPEPGTITVAQYERFGESVMHWLNFTQLFIPGDTAKSLTTHPDMAKLKDELFERYKDELHDTAVLSKIEAELEALDAEWLKDDPSLGLYTEPKDHKVVRKKLFRTFGHEAGFDDTVEANPIKKSLREGWDMTRFTTYNDTIRSGTYDRGAETALGGEFTKWILRAASNINITEDDCGTTLGMRVVIDSSNHKDFGGFKYVTKSGKAVDYDVEDTGKYMGRAMIIRSPMYCKLEHTDYCKVCMGDNLSEHVTGVSTALTAMGDTLMAMFMASMHGKALATASYDFNKHLV